ncbi:alpha/beta hydrolase, partial [Patescibacteria group bacterium]|nr:alpha/beta hydrolase [Patescibacteria group bacterium]
GHSFGGIIIQNYLNLPNSIQPTQFFLICSTPKIGGIKFLKKISYNLLARRSGDKKPFAYQTPKFYKKFEKSWDIDLARWFHDTVVTGGIINWFLHFLSLSPWHNQNLTTLNQETGYYLYGKKDIIITKSQQLDYLKKLTKVNGLEINSGHLAPITNPEKTAQLISKNIK